MLEHELNPAAAKFISSLVKSLQILCNGHVEFAESIELSGHINVRVDHIHKYDYIVDEQVSKEVGDTSTTFLSNSYHSLPPSKSVPSYPSHVEPPNHKQNSRPDIPVPSGPHTVKVSRKVPSVPGQKQDNIMVKMEGTENDSDCMVLPASPEDYEAIEGVIPQGGPLPGTSSAQTESFDIGSDVHQSELSSGTGKKRKVEDHSSTMCNMELATTDIVCPNVTSSNDCSIDCNGSEQNQNDKTDKNDTIEKNIDLEQLTKETLAIPQSINELKVNIAQIASMLNLQIVPNEGDEVLNMNSSLGVVKSIKKMFMDNMDKEKIQKLKRLLKMRNGKRKKQEFKALIAESGLSEDLVRMLAQGTAHFRTKYGVKDEFNRSLKKPFRLRTHDRQQKLLEMAESLKRSKGYNSNAVIVSKGGNRKISLHKSSICIFSHQSQFLSQDNVEEAAEALSGRMNKYGRSFDKTKDKKTISTPKRQHLKRKMRQLVNSMMKDIAEAGYKVIFSSTTGSDVDSHSAELTIVPIMVDEFFPEVKDDPKLEISEEDYARQLEREHFLEKQKLSVEKMKELEIQLTQILSGVEEVLATKRKRYGLTCAKPTDAERMKLFRKKLKDDIAKYQDYKQKRSLSVKKRRLSTLASKMKNNAAGSTLTGNDVNEENRNTPNLSLPQTVAPVNMHCPQVYVHPSTHQNPTPAVNMHHASQYVPGMQAGHQHQQSLSYSGELDIVELIAATHSVQNQHFA